MKQVATLSIAALFAVLTPSAQGAQGDIIMQTATRHVDFTPNFSTDYFTYADADQVKYLRQTLTLTNYDISSWTSTTGGNGIWVGAGYGQNAMAGSDIVLCTFRYYGSSNGNFVCSDRYANDNARPLADDMQNVTYIESTKTYNNDLNTATFSVTFDRPLQADESTGEDIQLNNGETYSAIWGFGRMSGSTIESHKLGSDRGIYQLSLINLSTPKPIASSAQTLLSALALAVLSVVMIFA